MSPPQETTFVCCVEPGPLEPMTVCLLESLRRHGGAFAKARFIACQPRIGPPLSRETHQRLSALNGEYVWLWRPRTYGWYHYLNKAFSLSRLDPGFDTEWVTFLDSDMLIAREPSALVADDVDFIACAPDDGIVGSTGREDPMDGAWRRIIHMAGLNLSCVPMIREHNTSKDIRFYFNSGAFSYRRSSGFSKAYFDIVVAALREGLGFPGFYEHYTDQVVLGLCALKLGLRWRALPVEYNLAIDRPAAELPDRDLAAGVLLHYHKGLAGSAGLVASRLSATHPELASWLSDHVPLKAPAGVLQTAQSEILRGIRGVPRALYRRRLAQTLRATANFASS